MGPGLSLCESWARFKAGKHRQPYDPPHLSRPVAAGGFPMMPKSISARALPWVRRVMWTSAALLFVLSAQAQADERLGPVARNDPGGSPFDARCPEGEVLTGFDLWSGDHVDAIRPLCIPALAGQFKPYPSRFGGNGGSGPNQLVCPNDAPVVIAMEIGLEAYVNNIHLYCGRAITAAQRTPFPMAVYDGPVSRGEEHCTLWGDCSPALDKKVGTLRCSAGLVGVGINGRSGKFLDALGLICGAPPVILPPLVVYTPPPLKAQGRVKLPGSTSRGSKLTICEAAAKARARNSPAAPGLEAQCAVAQTIDLGPGIPAIDLAALQTRGAQLASDDPEAGDLRDQQRQGPARRGFEIGLAASEGQTLQGPGKQRIHDLLSLDEQGGFTTAVNFSLSRNRQRITDMARTGRAIAKKDRLALELRDQQADRAARLGFDIGMAAAEGQTLPGPGKQKIHDSLNADEQGGFDAAVTFSLERNRQADLARVGGIIARRDQFVATVRNGEADVFYRLGFDIASGIFGDPALGARGNTASGPGSLKVRDSLSAAGQRGFNASMALHLSRHYRR